MSTIAIEALTPLDRTSSIKVYKNNSLSRPFRRIAKRSIVSVLTKLHRPGFNIEFETSFEPIRQVFADL